MRGSTPTPALESLARIGEDKTSVEPWLAEDISVDAQALTMVVTLREGDTVQRWHSV